jgi:hypothetical protein
MTTKGTSMAKRTRPATDDAAAMAVLITAMDEETAQAVIDQRKAIKEPLSALGAKGFVKEWVKIPEAKRQDALEQWALQNWRGFKSEWFMKPSGFEDRRHPSPKQMGGAPVTFHEHTPDHIASRVILPANHFSKTWKDRVQ